MIKKKWLAVLLVIALMLVANKFVWANSENTRTVTAQQIRESAENYLINSLDWNPESMDIEINYEAKDMELPEGKLLLDFGKPNTNKSPKDLFV